MRTACLINFDKVVKIAFNMSRWKYSPLFYWKIKLLQERVSESQKFPAELSEGHSTCPEWHFGKNSFFWKEKKIFLCSFPTFCWNFSKFLIHFGHLGQRLRNCWWNCTPLVRTKVLVGKGVCRSFHVYKTISSWSEKFWDLVKKSFPYGWQFGILIF